MSRSHAAVCAIPSASLYGNGPHTVSVADRSTTLCVSTLLRRNELKGNRSKPMALMASPTAATERATGTGTVWIGGAPNSALNASAHARRSIGS